MVGAAFIPATFFHFTVNLMEIYKRYKKYVLAFYVLSLMFILTDFSSLMVCGVTQRMIFKYWPTPGSLYLPYLCFFLGVVVFAHILIFRRLDKVTEIKRNQIKYVALGTAIGFLGGATNYPLWFNIPILPLGNVLVSVYVLLVAFSIIKYHLMDIRLVISNTTIFIVVYALVLGLPFLLGYKYNLWQLSTWAMLPLASIGPFISQYLQRKAGDKILQEEKRILDVLKKLSLGLIIIRDLRKLFNLVSHVLITNFSAKIFEIYILNHETNLYILKHCVPERPIQIDSLKRSFN